MFLNEQKIDSYIKLQPMKKWRQGLIKPT
jgi:hypothetical protein